MGISGLSKCSRVPPPQAMYQCTTFTLSNETAFSVGYILIINSHLNNFWIRHCREHVHSGFERSAQTRGHRSDALF